MDLKTCHFLVKDLLGWFAQEARPLPWRVLGRNHPNPYHVWLSEIMLQQTTVATVRPYFEAFIKRWPTPHDLAQASQDDLLTQWQGLGYYARARNMHKTAQILRDTYQGDFPNTVEALQKLPGIGPYTAAAIAAIAFDAPVVPVDGNIARIFARLYRLKTGLPSLLSEVREKGQVLTHHTGHHGDLAQGLMDLGAQVCTPQKPACSRCPLQTYCAAFEVGDPECFPVRKVRVLKPTKYATAFYLENETGGIWLQKRPESGMLASMMEVPSTPWSESCDPSNVPPESSSSAPLSLDWQTCPGKIKHTFTHFHLVVTVWHARAPHELSLPRGAWYIPSQLSTLALPTLMKKIIHHGREKGPSIK